MSDTDVDMDASDVVTGHDLDYEIRSDHFDVEAKNVATATSKEVSAALDSVARKLPEVQWESSAEGFQACVDGMPKGTPKNGEVIKFVEECMWQVLHIMVGLNSINISGPTSSPGCLSALQAVWTKDPTFDKYNRCFHLGLSNAARVMARIGLASTSEELSAWSDWEYNKQRHASWVASLELLLDVSQKAFRSIAIEDERADDPEPPNDLWKDVRGCFLDEQGFGMLVGHLDSEAFSDLAPDQVATSKHVFSVKVALMVKRLVNGRGPHRLGSVVNQGTADSVVGASSGVGGVAGVMGVMGIGSGVVNGVVVGSELIAGAPCAEEVSAAMLKVEGLSGGASEWLKGALNSHPDKLSQGGKGKDADLLDNLTELMGPQQSVDLARGLLGLQALGAQQQGLKLVRELRKASAVKASSAPVEEGSGAQPGLGVGANNSPLAAGVSVEVSSRVVEDAFATLPAEFFATLQTRLSGQGDALVKQLVAMKVVNKRAIVDALDELAGLMGNNHLEDQANGKTQGNADQMAVCRFWGDVGLRCLCTGNENTREIGIGLLEALGSNAYRFPLDQLKPEAEAALEWLKAVCLHTPKDDEDARRAMAAGTEEANKEDGDDEERKRSNNTEDQGKVDDEDEERGSLTALAAGGSPLVLATASAHAKASARELSLGLTPGGARAAAADAEAFSKSLDAAGLKEAERLTNLLTTLHHVLSCVGSSSPGGAVASSSSGGCSDAVASVWMAAAVKCLKCVGKYPVREMGLQMIQEAIRLHNPNAAAYASSNQLHNGNQRSATSNFASMGANKARLGNSLHAIYSAGPNLRTCCDALFGEHYCHHAVIRLSSQWVMETYYRDHCYEDEVVDLMDWLVEAAIHPEWGVVDAVTDLLVKITVTNISIKSLNSLCSLFKHAVENKATANAGNRLILTWIDKTRQKKWVIGVQERVLNLLYTMLVNKSSESEDDTSKVLDYFKNQFTNIRGHASTATSNTDGSSLLLTAPWSAPGQPLSSQFSHGVGDNVEGDLSQPPPLATNPPPLLERQLSEKEVTARNCITKCATDCLSEIQRSLAAMTSPAAASAAAAAAVTPVKSSWSSSSPSVPEPLESPPTPVLTAAAFATSASVGVHPTSPSLQHLPAVMEADELRSRATQAASLLIIVLDLVENMRPDVLRELVYSSGLHTSPLAMVQAVLDEAMMASQFEDMASGDSTASIGKRLDLVSALCSYLVDAGAPLNTEWIRQIWDVLFVGRPPSLSASPPSLLALSLSSQTPQTQPQAPHRLACLKWLTTVLRPKELQRDATYFAPANKQQPGKAYGSAEAETARALVLERLSRAVVGGAGGGEEEGEVVVDLNALGKDAIECLLSLFIWVNKDCGALKDADDLSTQGAFVFGSKNTTTLPPLGTAAGSSSALSTSSGGGGSGSAKVAASLFAGLGIPGAQALGLASLSFDASFEGEVEVVGEVEIVSFDALTVAALDTAAPATTTTAAAAASASATSPSSSTALAAVSASGSGEDAAAVAVDATDTATGTVWAAQTLLAVSEAVLRKKAALPALRGVGRFDLVQVLMTRIEQLSPTSSSTPTTSSWSSLALEHCLSVLCEYLKQTADASSSPAHKARSVGDKQLVIQVSLDPSLAATVGGGAGMPTTAEAAAEESLAVHNNTTLADLTARAVAALVPSSASSAAAAGVGSGNAFTWCLRVAPLFATSSAAGSNSHNNAAAVFKAPETTPVLKGSAKTTTELGLEDGASLVLCKEEAPFTLLSTAATSANPFSAGEGGGEDKQPSPSEAIAQNDHFQALLFALLEHSPNPSVCARAWEILQMSPTSDSVSKATEHAALAPWPSLLGPEQPFWRRVYLSQQVEAKLLPASSPGGGLGGEVGPADVSWRRSLFQGDGLACLLTLLDGKDLVAMDPLMRAAALSPLLRILHFTVTSALSSESAGSPGDVDSKDEAAAAMMAGLSLEPAVEALGGAGGSGGACRSARQFSATSSSLVLASVDLTKVMQTLFTVVRVGSAAAHLSEAEVKAVSTAMSTINVVVQRSGRGAWSRVSASFPLDVLVRLVLDSPVPRLRAEAAATFKELATGGLDQDQEYTLPQADASGGGTGSNAPLVLVPACQVLGPLFFGPRLASLDQDAKTANEFFAVAQALLLKDGWMTDPGKVRSLLEAKLRSITSPRVNATDGSDSVLVGVLKTFATLLATEDSSGHDDASLVDYLVDECLMRLPATARPLPPLLLSQQTAAAAAVTISEPMTGGAAVSESAVSGPVCGTPASRAAACELLARLCGVGSCATHEEALRLDLAGRVATKLAAFARLTATPDPPSSSYHRHSTGSAIKAFERPGLNNTANRCYMNSLTQQLAALQGFAKALINAPVPATVLQVDAEVEAKRLAELKAKDDPAAAAAAQEEAASGTWECTVCTFGNDAANKECDMCGSGKPANVKIVAAGADPEEERKEAARQAKAQKVILREFQRTLRFLLEGEMACFDAEALLGAVGKHLSLQYPAEQQNDTKEFMDKLLDRLEVELSDVNDHEGGGKAELSARHAVKQSFGATTAEIKRRQKDGKVVGRKPQEITTFSLEVKVEGVGSLEEAMEKTLEAEIREVDDDDEVDPTTGKPVKNKFEYVTRFVSLPSVLCVQLSRFSFDYGRGVPIKHNHRVTFPPVLDMGMYMETQAAKDQADQEVNGTALAEGEDGGAAAGVPVAAAKGAQEEEPASATEGASKTPAKTAKRELYRLRGVLVHLGPSANQGHYYSLIRSNAVQAEAEGAKAVSAAAVANAVATGVAAGKGSGGPEGAEEAAAAAAEFGTFLKFNDNHVSVAESMEDECFGGPNSSAANKYGRAHEKNWNAYLLFYERIEEEEGSNEDKKMAVAAATVGGAAAAAAVPLALVDNDNGGAQIRHSQAAEVRSTNADLWRRKLLFQRPVLELQRKLLEAACGSMEAAAADQQQQQQQQQTNVLAQSKSNLAQAGVTIFSSAVLHCEDVVTDEAEMARWSKALVGGVLDRASALAFLESVSHGETLLKLNEGQNQPKQQQVQGPSLPPTAGTAEASADELPLARLTLNGSGGKDTDDKNKAALQSFLATSPPEQAYAEAVAAVQAQATATAAAAVAAAGEGGEDCGDAFWAPTPFLTRNVLQVGAHHRSVHIGNAAAALLAGAANCAMAASLGGCGGEEEGATRKAAEAALTSLLKRLLGATATCYQEKDLLDGYVATLLALSNHPSLRPLLKRLDAPALLCHVFLNQQSPLCSSGLTCAVGSPSLHPLPPLPANSKRVVNSNYTQTVPLHTDFKPLLRALAAMVRPTTNPHSNKDNADEDLYEAAAAAAAPTAAASAPLAPELAGGEASDDDDDDDDLPLLSGQILPGSMMVAPEPQFPHAAVGSGREGLMPLSFWAFTQVGAGLVDKLVQFEPAAGCELPPPPLHTAEEEDRLLAEEGWKKHTSTTSGSKGWWMKPGHTSTVTKPSPHRPSAGELEETVLKDPSTNPTALLLVSMALLHPSLSDAVVESFVAGIEKFVYTAPSVVVKRRLALCLLLRCDDDGRMSLRRGQALALLEEKVDELRFNRTPAVQALKKIQQCTKMEHLTAALRLLRSANVVRAASGLGGDAPAFDGAKAASTTVDGEAVSFDEEADGSNHGDDQEGLEWVPAWVEARRPALRVHLRDLQGEWFNDEKQAVFVRDNQCSFGTQGSPVSITEDNESGTYAVPGWTLMQEKSFPGSVVWRQNQHPNSLTTWTRRAIGGAVGSSSSAVPIVTATVVTHNRRHHNNNNEDDDDDDDDLYMNPTENAHTI